MKQRVGLPTGDRAPGPAGKQAVSLPTGDQAPRPAGKQEISLPAGDQGLMATAKQDLDLPTGHNSTLSAGGVLGIHDNIGPTERPLGLLSQATNLQRLGQNHATTRPGLAALGAKVTTATARVAHIATFAPDGVFADEKIVVSVADELRLYESGAWTVIGSGFFAPSFQSAQSRDLLLLTNGGDAPQKLEYQPGTGNFKPLANLGGNPPKGAWIAVAYGRVFLANCLHPLTFADESHMLYASDISKPEVWRHTVDGAGKPARGDAVAIPINEKDGDSIRGLQVYQSNLLIWKRHALYELHGPEVGQPGRFWRVMPAAAVGTVNGRTIVEIDGVLFWLSDAGVVAWSGGKPEVISQPVRGVMDRIAWDGAVTEAIAGTDGNGYYILTVPVFPPGYVTLAYYTKDGSWWVWTHPSGTAGTVPSAYALTRKGQQRCLVGTWARVMTLGGPTDNGVPIAVEAVFGPSTGGVNLRDKLLRRAYVACSAGDGVTVKLAASLADTDAAGGYGAEKTLTSSKAAQRLRVAVPLATGQGITAYAPRLRVRATGQLTLHDAAIEYSETEN